MFKKQPTHSRSVPYNELNGRNWEGRGQRGATVTVIFLAFLSSSPELVRTIHTNRTMKRKNVISKKEEEKHASGEAREFMDDRRKW